MSNEVLDWLTSIELQEYYPNFEAIGIGPEEFLRLTVQSYPQLGITDLAQKQALFFLIQSLKTGQRPSTTATSGAVVSPAAPRAPSPVVEEEPVHMPESVGPSDLMGCLQKDKIRVMVRKRPMSKKETERSERDVLTNDSQHQLSVHEPRVKVDMTKYTEIHSFLFDRVFHEGEDNSIVYHDAARPLVAHLFTGGKATCFAYGQTGAGKTFTMMEPSSGIYVLAAQDIFNELTRPEYAGLSAYVSFFEIYGGKLHDLLNERKRLWAREDARGQVHIAGLSESPIHSVREMLAIIDDGLRSRSVGATGVNADSSRSHAILQITLRNERMQGCGKISFIDLAGSERAADTMASDRQTRMEGADINKSLLALKECIRALDKKAGHTPFRGSKLTMVLKDSFIGNARTVMIANCAPNSGSCENTLNTLRYADRVKEIKGGNKAGIRRVTPKELPGDAPVSRQHRSHGVEPGKRRRPAPRPRPAPVIERPAFQLPCSYEEEPSEEDTGFNPEAPVRLNREELAAARPAQEELERTHEDVVAQIYILEDEIVTAHREQVDHMMSCVKREVGLLHGVEQGTLPLDQWASELKSILTSQAESISALQQQLELYTSSLGVEEELSASARVH